MAKSKKSKRDKINDILDALEDWMSAYEGEESTEAEYEEACKALSKVFKILQAHKTTAHPPMKDHPDGDYYEITVNGKTVRRVRCKKCGLELDPKGFRRHIDGPVCKKNQEKLSKDDDSDTPESE